MKKNITILSIIVFGIVVVMIQCRQESNKNENPKGNMLPLTESWEFAIPNQDVPQGLTSLSAEQCGVCHVKHYEEWKISTHAKAWVDLQFQAELKKESSPFMCINCHIPLQNQQEYLIKGLIDGDIYQPVKEKNPRFDKNLQQEGITCASCHVRNNVIIGPTGTSKAPHKTVKDTVHLSEGLCIACHNAVAVLTPTLACTFETGDEWKSGPYYGKKNCKSCHMESITREIVAGYGERLSHLHFFAGSGIPKFDSVDAKGLIGLSFTMSNINNSYTVNEEIDFNLTLKNEFAGHNVPTGDPERFFIISFELKNERGEIVSTQTDRIGEKWEWHPEAKKISDNNLTPGESRTFTLSYTPLNKELLTLLVKVTKNRLDQKSAAYNKLGANYPLFITVFDEEYNIEVK